MINILIRTSFRKIQFNRLIQSIESQSYKNIKIIISYDDERSLEYIPEEYEKVRVHKHDDLFYFDNYCNDLKELVTDGWFMFIDDDDIITDSHALEKASRHLTGTGGVICQFSRNGRLKPSIDLIKQKRIQRSKIGMPCIILHHSNKNVANFDGSIDAADYFYIKAVSEIVKLKFVPIVVVNSVKRGNGKMED